MIIECVNCSKKFSVNSDLIPLKGRTIQCGSCNHIWFFKKNDENKAEILNDFKKFDENILEKKILPKKNIKNKQESVSKKSSYKENKGSEIIEYTPKSNFSFGKFLSYIIVMIISFIAVILFLDTFKNPLYSFYPELEFILFSLYETLKDIQLFIKDLIQL